MEEKKKDWLETITKNLLVNNFYKKFESIGEHKIYLKNIYLYLKNDLHMDWIKERPFLSKAKNIYNGLTTKFQNYKRNEKLQKIQRKYPELQINEAYFYLSLKNRVKMKDEDLELFEEMLNILVAKVKKHKK
jgi:hypothetical protein